MSQRARVIFVFLSLVFPSLLLPERLGATTVRQVSLPQMIRAADRIFVGKVVAVESRRDEHGLPATYVTFAVTETIKGPPGKQVTIKQIGGRPGTLPAIPGLPTYTVGEVVLLFLHRDSQYGFTSPVGLHQGKWKVVETTPGKKFLEANLHGSFAGQGRSGAIYGANSYAERSSGHKAASGKQLLNYYTFIPRLKKMAAR